MGVGLKVVIRCDHDFPRFKLLGLWLSIHFHLSLIQLSLILGKITFYSEVK